LQVVGETVKASWTSPLTGVDGIDLTFTIPLSGEHTDLDAADPIVTCIDASAITATVQADSLVFTTAPKTPKLCKAALTSLISTITSPVSDTVLSVGDEVKLTYTFSVSGAQFTGAQLRFDGSVLPPFDFVSTAATFAISGQSPVDIDLTIVSGTRYAVYPATGEITADIVDGTVRSLMHSISEFELR